MGKTEISMTELREKIILALGNAGVPAEAGAEVADSLIDAEMKGIGSHGLMRLSAYITNLRNGRIAAKPQMSVERVGEGMFLVDGGNGLGQVVTMYALRMMMRQAAEHGCGIAAIRHSNHFGTAGYYTRMAARAGFLAFITTNASATMPPFGGMEPKLGTNPFALSFPAGKYDNFTLDVATSAVARGKIRLCQKEGKPIPLGWAIDAEGNDTTDATKALAGGLLPMGAHKGYGMSMAVDYLSAIVPDANLCYETKTMFSDTAEPANNGHFLMVIDVKRFGDPERMQTRTEQWVEQIKSARVRPGFREILIPGEIENRREADCHGKVAIDDDLLQELERQCEQK